ncbi:hypothetical protein SESBI_51097, partial [Sesbania bispinosa]
MPFSSPRTKQRTIRLLIGFFFDILLMTSVRHFILCLDGTVAIGLLLGGRLKELKVVYILT